jgi:hypothetical protein
VLKLLTNNVNACYSRKIIDGLDFILSHFQEPIFPREEDDENSEGWKPVTNGLPEPDGTIISVLAANPKVAGEFYAINNRGIFCSTDSGNSWKMLDGIAWPKQYLSQHPRALAIREDR